MAEEMLSGCLNEYSESGDFFSGYLNGGEDEWKVFITNLRKIGYSFSVRNSVKRDGNDSIRMVYTHMQGDCKIPFFGSPFQIYKNCSMDCSQGAHYYDKQKKNSQHAKDAVSMRSRRQSQKIGCPATASFKFIKVYPEYEMDEFKKSRKKLILMKHLKKASISTEKPLKTEDRIYMKISKYHNHSTITTNVNQHLHPLLVKKIGKLVANNICSVKTIKMHLEECVRDMFRNSEPPHSMNRCYFPTNKGIYNHIHKAMYQNKEAVTIDLDALTELFSTFKESPEDRLYFRPYSDKDEIQTFLFCYQTKWQRDLLKRYCNNLCILDCTYKSIEYSWPIYFIAVKTNVGFTVVGMFIVQSEAVASLKEALDILKLWNERWNPRFFTSEQCDDEVSALVESFKATVYVCPFQRELAWKTWLAEAGNVCIGDEATILKLWRDVADSSTMQSYEEALTNCYTNEAVTSSQKAQEYFMNVWFPTVQQWVAAFQSKDFLWEMKLNEGAHNLNRLMSRRLSSQSLYDLMLSIHDKMFPEALNDYIELNCKSDNFQFAIPQFLSGRPAFFVKHVYHRYSLAKIEFYSLIILESEEGVFKVCSDDSKAWRVDFNTGSCSCFDYQNWRMPCKHMCAVFIFYEDHWFERLPAAYRNNPYFLIDTQFSSEEVTNIPDGSPDPDILKLLSGGGEADSNEMESSVVVLIVGEEETDTGASKENDINVENLMETGELVDDTQNNIEYLSDDTQEEFYGEDIAASQLKMKKKIDSLMDSSYTVIVNKAETDLNDTEDIADAIFKSQNRLKERLDILVDLSQTVDDAKALTRAADDLEKVIANLSRSTTKVVGWPYFNSDNDQGGALDDALETFENQKSE